jgi:serine/threonine-protein kinase
VVKQTEQARTSAIDLIGERDLVSDDTSVTSVSASGPFEIDAPESATAVLTHDMPRPQHPPARAQQTSLPSIEVNGFTHASLEDDLFDDATQVMPRGDEPSGIQPTRGLGLEVSPTPGMEASPPSGHQLRAGELISGKYRLSRLLGNGGMGSVWSARNELTDRDFAVKFLLKDLASNKEALHRFFLEARACGQIKHPAVVDVYDMGQAEDGTPYLVMELLEGEGLDARLSRAGTLRPAEAAMWIAFIARGLEEAHVRGLVHRDLKPGNIFFALDDRGDVIPKILDFGVSKASGPTHDFVKTTTGAVLGSPAYMSPEQARGENDIDGRSDVWSLGVILYEALTGVVPFDAPNYNALMVAIITQHHRPLKELVSDVPAELEALVDNLLDKDRTKRVSTAREVADQLEHIAAKLSPGPIFSPKITGLSHGHGVPSTKPFAVTQGTSRQSRKPQRSVAVPFVALMIAIAAASGIAFFRMRAPSVAVAGRSAAVLEGSLARLNRALEQVQKDAAAKAKEDEKHDEPVTLQPAELPPAKPKGPGKPHGSASPKGSSSPHGVDGPGF